MQAADTNDATYLSEQISRNQITRSYSRASLRIVAFCFVLSGATGLIYEVLWMRMLGLVFGATTLAVSTVLVAFMGGLALGSALAGRLGGRIQHPLRVYGFFRNRNRPIRAGRPFVIHPHRPFIRVCLAKLRRKLFDLQPAAFCFVVAGSLDTDHVDGRDFARVIRGLVEV